MEIVLESPSVDEIGFVRDYGELKAFKTYLDQNFDHRHLNDVLEVNPTAENLAKQLFEWARLYWREVAAVRVSETPKTWAEYREVRS